MMEELSKISHLERRFLVSLVLTLFMSYAMKNRVRMHNLLSAVIILYIAFDYKHTLYVMSSIALNMLLLRYTVLSEYAFTILNMGILYLYKIFGVRFESRISGSFDISGVLMLMTIKMCYLGKECHRRRDRARDILSYLLFIPGLLLGPVPTFERFRASTYKRPQGIPYGTFLRSLVFLALFQFLRTSFPRESLFVEKSSFLARVARLYLFNVGNRIKFYFAWHFSHGCFIFQNFPDLLNVDYLKVEFASSVKDLSTYWNVCTGVWLKNCFFIPLKDRSIFWASIGTSSMSALWHGINPCYLIMFISFSMFIPVVRENNRLLSLHCPSISWIVSKIQMLLYTTYFSSPFFLLSVSDLMRVWKSVYFVGHVVFVSCLLLQLGLRCLSRPGARKTE